MTIQVPVRLTQEDVAALDRAVAAGRFASRSAALRSGLARLLAEERELEMDEAYRRGYARNPQEEWVGAAGLAALAGFDRAEDGEPL